MPVTSNSVPTRSRSGNSLAVAGARAPGRVVVRVSGTGTAGDVLPRAVATSTGGAVSPGASTVSAAVVDLGGRPAAESTHVFMFAIRRALALSRFAFCTAAVTAATESDDLDLGGMKVANCACVTAGAAMTDASTKQTKLRRSTIPLPSLRTGETA
jgi:hypothetical protein